jgi:hypothetical protein
MQFVGRKQTAHQVSTQPTTPNYSDIIEFHINSCVHTAINPNQLPTKKAVLDQASLSLDLWSVTSVRAGDESLHATVNY